MVRVHEPKTHYGPKAPAEMSPPPPDFVKINFDASFHAGTGNGGWGVIARDADGDVALAAAGVLSNQGSALQAEAEALLQAIKLAEQYSMGRVIFETDCLVLQQACSSSSADRGPLGVLFREAKFQLRLGFIDHRVMFCPRVSNEAAHVLASCGGRGNQNGHVWHADLPNDVTRIVTADLVGPS